MECEFCNKIFSSKSSLNNHQKTTKYCLKLQGKLEEEGNFICDYCKKTFTVKTNLISHHGICKEKEFNDNFKKREEELQKEFNKEKEELQKEINELKQKVAELNGRLFTLKDDHELIKEIAKQPKTTTNNTTNNTLNITTCLDFNNIDKIKNVIENDFDIDYAVRGQKGLAHFVNEKLLKDDNGKLIYICTDPSRQIFKYKDDKGEIRKDVEAKKLTNYIVDGGIKIKTTNVSKEWYTNDDGNLDMTKFTIMLDQQQSILKLKDDNNTFKKELASLTSE